MDIYHYLKAWADCLMAEIIRERTQTPFQGSPSHGIPRWKDWVPG